MFKLKPGNVFQKLNTMDRKQAYTWGAVVIVVFIALITLASFLGKADDESFDGLTARGYDLAQMPFVNDEAEAYLLASKYPDMQGNGATVLYSAAERAAREEADAENSAASDNEDEDTPPAFSRYQKKDSDSEGGDMRSRRGGSRGRGAGAGGGTTVGQLGSASMGRASGSGVGGSWGAPRGDFSPYKSQEKGKEIPAQLKNQDARKALYQFARGSQAAAGLKDGKGGNARKALMGGNIQGSEAFSDKGVDLSKLGGLALDTNAPTSSADLSNLAKDVSDAANNAENKNNEDNETLWDKLKEQLLTSLVDIGTQAIGTMVNKGIDSMFASFSANSAGREYATSYYQTMTAMTPSQCTDPSCQAAARGVLGDSYDAWAAGDTPLGSYAKDNGITNRQMRRNMENAGGSMPASMVYDAEHNTYVGATRTYNQETGMYEGNYVTSGDNYLNAWNQTRAEARGRSYSGSGSHQGNSASCSSCYTGCNQYPAGSTEQFQCQDNCGKSSVCKYG